jgi:PIN domain nuclease of toxin-antitoxin system
MAVASVSCLEVALLVKKGRLRITGDLNAWFRYALQEAGIRLLPLTPEIAVRSAALPDLHGDPIDRVLIATALEHDAVFLTKDAAIHTYPGVQVSWE